MLTIENTIPKNQNCFYYISDEREAVRSRSSKKHNIKCINNKRCHVVQKGKVSYLTSYKTF